MNAPCPQALHVMSFLREVKSFVLFPGLRCLDVSLQHICDYNLPLIMLAISPKLSTLALSNIGTKHQDWMTTFLSSLYPESLSSIPRRAPEISSPSSRISEFGYAQYRHRRYGQCISNFSSRLLFDHCERSLGHLRFPQPKRKYERTTDNKIAFTWEN